MLIRWIVGGALVLALAGCTQATNRTTPTRSVTSAGSATTPSASATPAPTTATPTMPPRAALPGDCGLLLTGAVLDKALGKPLTGQTSYIKGVAEPKIGRTGRVTCRYGVRGKSIPVEVGVSGYQTAAQAAARVRVTVSAERDAGARVSTTTIAGQQATILLGRHGSLLVYGDSNRTVAVTLAAGVGGSKAAAVLTELSKAVAANLP